MTQKRANAKSRTTERTQARGELTRDRILAAAVEAFAEKGYQAASTRDVAQRAKIDQGLLTYHFPNKDDLWKSAAERIFGAFDRRMEELLVELDHEDPKKRAREFVREFVRFSAANPEFFRFMVDEGNLDDDRSKWLVDTYLKKRFETMKERGIVRAAGYKVSQAPHVFYSLMGAVQLIFAVAPNCKRLTGLDPAKPKAIEAHAEFVAHLIVP
ncbi:MAG: TetR/AcrR family transcriptional regulator [Myxococcales bacterium]|nr:TetR/AcrR family transcriptional regulator [Myxococcales bacterium]HIM03306.1 TetR/AcrR family transcriptional regulator [Myxococcales bacterium]